MPKFMQRPVVIEAFQVMSDRDESSWPEWAKAARAKHEDEVGAILYRPILPGYCIETLQGRTIVEPGDWILCGERGEIFGCKDDDFRNTYSPVVEE